MPDTARRALLTWFDQHKRDLPWRRTRDPYAIWVSEIMLQQTRVAAVLEHYARWMQRFPTLTALAEAEESEVLALWSGLGYYRRARMLHRAAQAIASERGGALPRTAVELRALPGIGEYTSAAIASIAFGEPVAVVDGNVERVVSRLAALDSASPAAALKQGICAGAAALLSPERPGDSNQAMMDLGATVCLPKAPLCLHCPVQPWCQTRGEHRVLPRKPQQARDVAYVLAIRSTGTEVLLRQRAGNASLMAGMWELPELDTARGAEQPMLRLKHAITVTNYTVSIVAISEAEALRLPGTAWQPTAELPRLALTGLARKVLRRLGLWPSA